MVTPAEGAVRAAIVAAAHRWRGTPWRHAAQVPGPQGGVDCGRFVLACLQAAGVVPTDLVLPWYPDNWFVHRDDHVFEPLLARWLVPTATPQPGDVVGFRVGRARIGHAGIVTAWPAMLHATPAEGVVAATATAETLVGRLVGTWGPA